MCGVRLLINCAFIEYLAIQKVSQMAHARDITAETYTTPRATNHGIALPPPLENWKGSFLGLGAFGAWLMVDNHIV